jgi:hypothetical protein
MGRSFDDARREERLSHRRRRRDFPGQGVMLELLAKADRLREKQRLLADELYGMLTTGYPGCDYECYRLDTKQELAALREAWDEFTARGGVSADDLKCFIRGELFGAIRSVNKRGHLRLVHCGSDIRLG